MVPFVSVSSTWSIRTPTSRPATDSPSTRWVVISFWTRFWPMRVSRAGGERARCPSCRSALVQRAEGAVGGTDVVAARPDEPIVRVLLHHVRAPPRDPRHRDDGDEEVDRDA